MLHVNAKNSGNLFDMWPLFREWNEWWWLLTRFGQAKKCSAIYFWDCWLCVRMAKLVCCTHICSVAFCCFRRSFSVALYCCVCRCCCFGRLLALNSWLFFGIVVVVVVGKICAAICVTLLLIFHVVNITTNHTFNVHSHFYWTNYWQLFIKPNHIKICFVWCSVVVFFLLLLLCLLCVCCCCFTWGHCGSFTRCVQNAFEDYSVSSVQMPAKNYFVNTFTHNM